MKLQLQEPSTVDVAEILADKYGPEICGGSPHGWHAIADFMACPRRAFYGEVRGLTAPFVSDGLQVGTLGHVCLALHYATGGARTYEPIDAVHDTCPEIADEALRLLQALFGAYGREEAATWDVRAVEHPVHVAWQGVDPVTGLVVRVPLTGRIDLVVARREPNAPVAPYGPVADGVSMVDHKLLRALDKNEITSFSINGQLLTYALLWRLADLTTLFGPLRSFIVHVIVKTKVPRLERVEIKITDEDVDRHAEMLWPVACARYHLLESLSREDPQQWPMRITSCRTVDGPWRAYCKYLALCESHGRAESLYAIRRVEPTAGSSPT